MNARHMIVVHKLRRRLRVVAPALRGDEERALALDILLRKREGISEVRAVPSIGSVTVRFDPRILPAGNLIILMDAVIGNLGRKQAVPHPVEPVPAPSCCSTGIPPRQISAAIEGMTCASCALLIEMHLRRDPRVSEAAVNFASGTVTVRGNLDRDGLFALVAKLGYQGRPMDTLAQRRMVIESERQRLEEARSRAKWAMLLSLPVMALGMAMPRSLLLRAAEFLFTTPVVLWAGRPFFDKALALARQRSSNMDTLIALGAGSAYGYSTAALLAGRHHLYFEAASGIVAFVLLGRYLEEKARGKAGDAVRKLIDLQPPVATLWMDGEEKLVPVDDLKVGDCIIIRPGERIPTDGKVESGSSAVDESLLTGESMPVVKDAGAGVTGGCVNGSGMLRVRVTAVGQDTVLAGIVRLVDHAQATKLPIQKIVDRISSVFVPGVLGMAGLTFLGWLAGGRSLTGAMANALSVLLIACPCSLGLATPTAIMAGIGQGARRGIFIRNGESLELASRITHLVFDKTGTLTVGKAEVAHIANLSDLDDEAFLTLAAAAEIGSEHHLGRAIVRHARQKGLRLPEAADFLSLPGHGVRAFVEGMPVVAGNLAMLSDEGVDDSPLADSATSMAEAGLTPVLVAIGGKAAGVIGIADRVRPSARLAIEALHRSGVRIMMVTGDVPLAARRIAAQLGIDEIHASATPERKLEIIRERQAAGAVVGMVGDGTNDAPALAAADVGFAIGSGTDVAIEAAHVTLIGGDPVKVAEAIELSRRTMRIIRQNLFWAMGYNIVAIPWAAVGRLTPMLASTAMALSSVSVVTNSLRLQREGPK